MLNVLEVRDLRIHFNIRNYSANIVDKVNINIQEGEIVGLVGESGCGKTITSKAIMGLLPQGTFKVEGSILYRGKDLLRVSEEEMHRIRGKEMAWIPQDPMTSLNPVFTIEDQMLDMLLWRGVLNVSFFGYLRKRRSKETVAKLRNEALGILEKLRIPDPERVLKSYPIQLSGGMRQRILIAMALAGRPRFIVADEPGTSLDVSIQSETLQLMKDKVREEGISELFITHDLAVAKKICDRIYVMYAGTVCEVATNRELFLDPKHPYTIGLFDSVPKLTGNMGPGIGGMIPDYSNPPPGCRFHPRCPFVMEICRRVRPPLFKVSDSHFVSCHLYGSDHAE